ncbi:MAG: glycosyltransferase family 4 protein [Deltaproteobacteria bacterium]|nr:MAG: glycosyltransferase family 4 protein [Deltaproteobacteria bacterium]
MKIGVISTMNGLPWGGSEELWASMVEEALKERFEVAVSICHEAAIPSKFPSLQHNGVPVFRRRPLLWRRVENVFSKIASPFREIFSWNPDVICISQGWTYESLYFNALLDALYDAAIPYVVLCQFSSDDAGHGEIRDAAKEFFDRAFRVVFVSRKNLKSVERQLAHTLTNGIVLQNPVNLSDLSAVPYSSSVPLSMANVARLRAAYKGQDILLEVLGSPLWRGRDWRLRFYGEGQDRKYLEALAQHYAIADRVEFCGYVNDIRSIWQVNHLLALPSRGEGTPLALVEGMLCGRPAVVTDVGGNAEWIDDEQTGFVAEAPTAKSFGAALERAWLVQADWQQMGIQGRQKALIKFDKSAGKSLLKILLDAIHSSQPNLLTNPDSLIDGITRRGRAEAWNDESRLIGLIRNAQLTVLR